MINQTMINYISEKAFGLMTRRNLVFPDTSRPVFYAWPREDRVILVIDPELVKNQQRLLSNEFRHDLSTVLNGRRVVTTNSRGIFIQVALNAPPIPHELRPVPLDLTHQPGPLHFPIGLTRSGPLWISIVDADSVGVGGSRRMGKTRFIHGCIQALKAGGQSRLILYDGKGGMEFGRYAGENVVVASDLRASLIDLQTEIYQRRGTLKAAGVSSVAEYNSQSDNHRLAYLVLVIDEVAHIPTDCMSTVSELVGTGGAYGIHPILATTYLGHKEVQSLVKANLSTRMCFPVPSQVESRVILGQKGAEDLPKVPGRMLITWQARLIEAQTFAVELPPAGSYQGPVLTGIELEVARNAVSGSGWLSIELFKQSYSMSEREARNLLDRWQSRGWVEKDPYKNNARRVTPILQEIVSQSGHTGQACQTGQTEEGSDGQE